MFPSLMSNDNTGDELQLAISLQAHKYVKSKTHNLTKLLNVGADKDTPSAPPPSHDVPTPFLSSVEESPYTRRRLRPTSAPDDDTSQFAKDYARIIHSPSFRRLQGKTQLIPSGENEFFRTRLTHSLEVGEIAVRIAKKLNREPYFKLFPIDLDLVMCASLLHDIGHPPFGHSGEETLNRLMQPYGGFEGNAQTLRIVTCLEARLGRGSSIQDAIENARGLNPTAGTIASILKYDKEILAHQTGPEETIKLEKGFYTSEKPIVDWLRQQLGIPHNLFTIECQIMDMADDIAYSAYDLEDTLEAGIVAPFDLMAIDDELLLKISEKVTAGMKKRGKPTVEPPEILLSLAHVFGSLLVFAEQGDSSYDLEKINHRLVFVGRTYLESLQHAKNPLVRRQFLETLIERNIKSLRVSVNEEYPVLSKLEIDDDRVITIESLKAFNFHKVINSRRLEMHHSRNKKIISGLFEALRSDTKGDLLSESFRHTLNSISSASISKEMKEARRMRLVAEFISGLTDAEAINLYDQMHSSRGGHFWNYWR